MRTSTIKEKVKAIWRKYKWPILLVVTASGIVLACSRNEQKNGPSDEELEEAVKRELLETEEEVGEEADIPKEEPACEDSGIDDTKLTEGGSIVDNNLYEPDCPNCLCNEVPLTSMGAFGRDMIELLKDEYPDYEKTGPFDPDTAIADVWVDFGHAKWLAAHKKEETNDQLQDSAQ